MENEKFSRRIRILDTLMHRKSVKFQPAEKLPFPRSRADHSELMEFIQKRLSP